MQNARTLATFAILFNVLAAAVPVHAMSTTPVVPSAIAQGHPGCAGITYETPQTRECDAVIAGQPYPDVTPVPYSLGVLTGQDFIYFDTDEVPLYDAPGGTRAEILTTGRSSYFNVLQTSGDWAEIRPGRWASLDDAIFAEPSTLTGVLINHMEMPWPGRSTITAHRLALVVRATAGSQAHSAATI